MSSAISNVRPSPDRVLVDIADYVRGHEITSAVAFETARNCLIDTLGCGLEALEYKACTKFLGPIIPGMSVPNGAKVPGTSYQLDPVQAAFNLGTMVRWLDFNDTFTAAQGSHPSDNLGGILAAADALSRERAARRAKPLLMRDVLEALVKAYEIQGCIAIENDFKAIAIDHPLLTRVASSAVLTRMLGGTHAQVVNAVSNAWVDSGLAAIRHAPNTGWRKSWAAADATHQALKLALMAVKGEMGYPSVLTAPKYGFYAAHTGGKPFKFQRPYGDYVLPNSMFKFVAAGMHSQSSVECAFRLHALVKDRIADIARIEIHSQAALMGIMYKTGPLHNPADRDHCVQYIVAVGLIHGELKPQDFENEFAADPRIDQLRELTVVSEEPRYSRDFVDPAKRSSANAVQVFFKDGSSTPKIEIEYPIGHQRRRTEVMPVLQAKFAASLKRRYTAAQCERITTMCADAAALDATPADRFVDAFIPA